MVAAVKLRRQPVRRRLGRFLAEGPNLLEAAARRGLIDDVFATPDAAQRYAGLLGDLAVHLVSDAAAQALSDTVTPVGLVAVCRTPSWDLRSVLAARPELVAVAVDLAEPGNAGTMIRTADAMGAAAVVLAGHSVDPFNGKCLRSSAGSIFAVPVLTETDVTGLITSLQAAELQVLAATIDGETTLEAAEQWLDSPTAWLFGPESRGLAPEIAALADHRIAIPMAGAAESLNVAAAAAICLYQSARARSRRLG